MKAYITKLTALILAVFMLTGALAGCAGSDTGRSGRLSIVATIFPEYDWVLRIAGERGADMDISLLLNGGTDLHSYQPSVDDIVRISTCDMFIYVGGESDKWVGDVLAQRKNKDMIIIDLLDVLGDSVKEEEFVEGMEPEDEDEEEGAAYDEHVWLSLKNASVFCGCIRDRLCELDADGAAVYKANAAAYIEKLNALDARYQEAADNARFRTLLFGDRFPFRYLVDDYGLSYYAAFLGCSAETEASFDTIVTLADKADRLGLQAIITIESSDGSIARTVREATASKDQEIITLDSMQSVTDDDIKNGASYLSIMEDNLTVLKKALN